MGDLFLLRRAPDGANFTAFSTFAWRAGDCQESCVRGHNDADGGRL